MLCLWAAENHITRNVRNWIYRFVHRGLHFIPNYWKLCWKVALVPLEKLISTSRFWKFTTCSTLKFHSNRAMRYWRLNSLCGSSSFGNLCVMRHEWINSSALKIFWPVAIRNRKPFPQQCHLRIVITNNTHTCNCRRRKKYFRCDLMVNFQSATFICDINSQPATCCLHLFFVLFNFFIMCIASCFTRKYNLLNENKRKTISFSCILKLLMFVFGTHSCFCRHVASS